MKIKMTIITLIIFLLSGCSSVLVPQYDPSTKVLKIDNYRIKNVISYERKLNKRVDKNSRGLIKIYSHDVYFNNEVCSKMDYTHAYVDNRPGRNGTVKSYILDEITKNDKITKVDNIYFIHKPNNEEGKQFFIFSKIQTRNSQLFLLTKNVLNLLKNILKIRNNKNLTKHWK